MPADSPPREAWDYAAFVRHYNEFAREFGGWNFDPTYLPEPPAVEHPGSAALAGSA